MYNDVFSNPVAQAYPLISLFDLAYFQNNQAYPNPDEVYVFAAGYDDATFNPNREYGLTDLVSQDLDTYQFWNLYNDTFYSSRVWDPSTKTYSYVPDFMVTDDEKNFIVPDKESSLSYEVTLNKRFLPVFSKTCFEGVFQQKGNSAFINFFIKLNIGFLSEYIISSFTLCMMLALQAYYCEYFIRYYIIERIISNDINDYDFKSEKYTKYTHKILEFAILFITAYYTMFTMNLINDGINAAQLLFDYECFTLNNPLTGKDPDDYKNHINTQFVFYIEFLKKLNIQIKLFLAVVLINLILQVLVTITYPFADYEPIIDHSLADVEMEEIVEKKND